MEKAFWNFLKIFILFISCAIIILMPAQFYFNMLTGIFITLTIAGAISFIILKQPTNFVANYASTMGVLGTFVGIFAGLSDFDVADIQSSIPMLLEGLKTAFVTSIVGMIVSMLVKTFYRYEKKKEITPIVVEDASSKRLLNEICVISRDIRRQNDSMLELLAKGVNEINETQCNCTRDIEMKIEKFGQIVAEQSSKDLIGAIQKVMEDFNAKINDQLGQSFKELTESCKELNKWQQEHIGLLQAIEKTGSIVRLQIEETVVLMDKFNANCNLYNENAEAIKRDLIALGQFIERVQTVGGRFENVMPIIESRMNEHTQRIAEIISVYEQNTKKHLNNSALVNERMNTAMQTFSEHLNGVLKVFHERIQGIEKNHNTIFR